MGKFKEGAVEKAETIIRPDPEPVFLASDFEAWVPVAEAVAKLTAHFGGSVARETFWRWLQLGKLEARAEAMILPRGEASYAEVPPSWLRDEPPHYDSFWLNGIYDTVTENSYRQRVKATAFQMRVDPLGLERMFPQAATKREPAPEAETTSSKPVVSRAELARWHDVFKGVHPDAPEALALRSAAAMFPDHNVPRQYVRDLRGPQKRGKPARRHD